MGGDVVSCDGRHLFAMWPQSEDTGNDVMIATSCECDPTQGRYFSPPPLGQAFDTKATAPPHPPPRHAITPSSCVPLGVVQVRFTS